MTKQQSERPTLSEMELASMIAWESSGAPYATDKQFVDEAETTAREIIASVTRINGWDRSSGDPLTVEQAKECLKATEGCERLITEVDQRAKGQTND